MVQISYTMPTRGISYYTTVHVLRTCVLRVLLYSSGKAFSILLIHMATVLQDHLKYDIIATGISLYQDQNCYRDLQGHIQGFALSLQGSAQ